MDLILYNIPDENDFYINKLYVALSRARYKLYLFLDVNDSEVYSKLLKRVK